MALSSSSVGSYITTPDLAERLKTVEVQCNHGLKAHIEVCKRGQNVGKLFFSCPLWNKAPCGYFRWVHDVLNEKPSNSNVSSADAMPNNEVSSLARLEAKCQCLKEQKAKLAVAYDELKHELMIVKNEMGRCKEREKGLCRLLFVSWVGFFIGIVAYASQV